MRDGLPLSARLLRQVLLPLALTWLAGSLVAAGIAYHFTQRAFDRSLLDDAVLIASNVHLRGDRLELTLTLDEVNRVLFDQTERMLFSVRAADGSLVAGVRDLPALRVNPGAFEFGDLERDGLALRTISLHRESPRPFDVVVAETTRGRSKALQRLVWWSLLPQALLLMVLAAWLRRAIRGEVRPLAHLEAALGRRGAADMAPVQVEHSSREVEALSAALNDLLARLDRSLRAQREFAGNVAHELRTPLAAIRALADYGLAQDDPAAWREQLRKIAASEARASRMVDQLLDLALALEAEAGLQTDDVALDELVRDAVLRFLPRADAAGVDLGARGIEAAAVVRANASLVEGILNNLLDNALRYGGRSDAELPAVTVALQDTPSEVVLSVQDNGHGLPGEMQAQLVQRGAQGETGQLLGEGAGLGLALVAQYARLMDARMNLGAGDDGRGWRCEIGFPRRGDKREQAR
ncbi:histidine kinase [Ramlibacter henchirensis]|uniref:histidine kinase n=1 Tax=Ramlibacter henchirensis TaxID=204072 RepID=A0A4Z0C702_9BURK|nr:sensor histidine kinase N-terminal domain-containing protein [Ramlibacter henchirensis]TFZ07446.1 histidine kinase [Ramlibacter henchirensis]